MQDSWNSQYDSYKPPTPSMHGGDENILPAVGNTMPSQYYYDQSVGGGSSASAMGQTMGSTLMTQEALEEKRRKALREKEREVAARLRQRELMNQKREMELTKKLEDERIRREQEQSRLEAQRREEEDREKKRLENQILLEEKARQENEERRRLAQIEKKREQALRQIEMQRLKEEEGQRIKREVILRKRKEMERVRDEAERMFALKKKDEMERKMTLVSEMKSKREERLVELEKRRTNPLLVQQEKEFNQLIELQASTGRLATKLEQIQSQREDVRERLLEARHITEMLEIEEKQLSISVEEVETDLKKLNGYKEGLSRLVSTRYDTEEYEKAVITIQRIYRGHKSYTIGQHLRRIKEERELELAAIKIQKVYRGRIIRQMQKDERTVRSAVRLQCALRCMFARRVVGRLGVDREEERSVSNRVMCIQNAWRCHVARQKMSAVKVERDAIEQRQKHRRRPRPHEPPPGGPGKGGSKAKDAAGGGKTPRSVNQSNVSASVNRSSMSSAGGERGGGGGGGGGGGMKGATPRGTTPRGARQADVSVKDGGGATPRNNVSSVEATTNVSHAVSAAPSRGVGGGKRKQSKGPTRVAGKGIGGELGRIYMAAPKDKSGASARAAPSGDPRVRRFVPTSATAAVAASAEDAGTFAPLVDQMDRTPVLHDLSGAGERMSIND